MGFLIETENLPNFYFKMTKNVCYKLYNSLFKLSLMGQYINKNVIYLYVVLLFLYLVAQPSTKVGSFILESEAHCLLSHIQLGKYLKHSSNNHNLIQHSPWRERKRMRETER